jgi:hypothetical protein
MCDFWARVKIQKQTVEELSASLQHAIAECASSGHSDIEEAILEYWTEIGIKSMPRLCREEPDLCEKMREAETIAKSLLLTGTH